MKIDLNCDLGEGEPLSRMPSLMRWITSANVACGGHAGDLGTMDSCIRLAKQFGVRLGAHPGLWTRSDFGRGKAELTPDQFELLLLHQVGALELLALQHRMKLHHVKLHGALYHASEQQDALARRYLAVVSRCWPGCAVYARAGGRVARLARRTGKRVWEEVFADRNYHDDGSLLAREEPGALITEPEAVRNRVRQLIDYGELRSVSGRTLQQRADTICLHSDTPGAARLAREVSLILREREK
jgi:UPF0271 protein